MSSIYLFKRLGESNGTCTVVELYILAPLKSYYAAGSWRSDEFEALGGPL